MKTVKLKRNFPYEPKEIEIPEGVTKEWVEDYQDNRGYWKYFYINKKGNKKECKVEWV